MPGRPSRRSPAFLPWKGESHSADRPHFMNLRDVLRRVAGSAAFGFRHGRGAEQNASHVEDMTFGRVVPNGLPFGVALFRVTTVAGGGTVKLSTGYLDAENDADSSIDIRRYTVSAGYEYPLSKRTYCYAIVGYQKDTYGRRDVDDADSIGVASGLVVQF